MKTCILDKETFRILSDPDIINCTDDEEYNYISNQHCLAHEWLKAVRRCKCKLDETSGDCRHIRKALHKLHGKKINEMWNNSLKERIQTFSDLTGFKVPYGLQKELSGD